MFNVWERQPNIVGGDWGSNKKLNRIGACLVVAAGLAAAFFYVGDPLNRRTDATRAYVGFDPTAIDLGTHLWKQKVEFSLNFVNNSTVPVALRALKTSCGCAFIDQDRYRNRVIGPSETLTVDVCLHTQERPGLKSRQVTLVAGDGAAYTASVSVDVKAPYFLDRRLLNFGVLPESTEPVYRSVSFVSDSVTLVGQPRIDGRWLAAEYVKRDEIQTDVVVSVAPDKLLHGLNVGSVIIRTTDKVVPRGCIKVIARGGLSLRPIPPHIVRHSGEAKIVQFLVASGGCDARIQAASSDNESIQAAVCDDGSVKVRSLSGSEVHFATVRVSDSNGLTGKVLVSVLKGE